MFFGVGAWAGARQLVVAPRDRPGQPAAFGGVRANFRNNSYYY